MNGLFSKILEKSGPKYLAIADAIEESVALGLLQGGDRLPTQRKMAEALGITVGTVNRAYAEAEKRKLIKGVVGAGTTVLESGLNQKGGGRFGEVVPGLIDFSLSVPAVPVNAEEAAVFREGFERLANSPRLGPLLEVQPQAGRDDHRLAGAQWISRAGYSVDPEQVLICCGGQHAMATVFSAIAQPGDVVAAECLSYPAVKGLAHLLHLRLEGLPMDGEGLIPEAFEALCKRQKVRLLYTIPTVQNPTNALMGESRRRQVAAIAQRFGVDVVEDDTYGLLPEKPHRPISSFCPERGYYLMGLSKLVAPGFRVGFLAAPREKVKRLAASIWATTWMAPPPMAEVICRWIFDGTMERFVAWKREFVAARGAVLQRVLSPFQPIVPSHAFHCWFPLPPPWRNIDFVARTRERGLLLASAEDFAVGSEPVPHAVRISYSAVASDGELEAGLHKLVDILSLPPVPGAGLA